MLKALFADAEAWTMVEAPRYREVRHAELSHRLAAANFRRRPQLTGINFRPYIGTTALAAVASPDGPVSGPGKKTP